MADTLNVDFIHDDLRAMESIYTLVEDCMAGEIRIKSKREVYLPRPNATDVSVENIARYESYITRAVFYNVVKRTVGGLTGQVFMRPPITEIPRQLEYLLDDVGSTISLEQLARKTFEQTSSFGRCGLFTDFPETAGPITVADMINKNLRPTIVRYGPMSIINWRTKVIGSYKVLSKVVLQETYVLEDDGFEEKLARQFRVLNLDSDGEGSFKYTVDIYRDEVVYDEITRQPDTEIHFYEGFVPLDANGNTLTYIPFRFTGSVNNDPEVDPSPIYDIASLNVAHYRNSADYEESCYTLGQPTPYFSGLTKEWVQDVMKDKVHVGARASVLLPEGANAGLLQVAPNTMPFEAMGKKEEQMLSIGAKLIQPRFVEKTATEASLENAADNSILSTISTNVSAALTAALYDCAVFLGLDSPDITYKLTTEFDFATMNPEDRRQLVEEYNNNLLTFSEARLALKKSGLVHDSDVVAKLEMSEKKEKNQEINKPIENNSVN